jgi:hypothetical protein
MMIDLKKESPIALHDARMHRLVKSSRGQAGVSYVTIANWARRGIDGHKLETVKIGRVLCTSEEALIRFFTACSEPSAPPVTTAKQRNEAKRRAAAVLDRAGI